MITAGNYVTGNILEYLTCRVYVTYRGGYAMKYLVEVNKAGAECNPDGLVAEANPKYGSGGGKFCDQRKQKPCLLRNSRPGRKDDLIELRYFIQCDLVIEG